MHPLIIAVYQLLSTSYLCLSLQFAKAIIAFVCKHISITGLYVDSIHSYLLLPTYYLLLLTIYYLPLAQQFNIQHYKQPKFLTLL